MQTFKRLWSKTIYIIVVLLVLVLGLVYCKQSAYASLRKTPKQVVVADHWKDILTPEQYHVLREAGTELPFTGALNHEKRSGTYYSVGCNKAIFRSEKKYDSGTGWPSFTAPIHKGALVLRTENAMLDNRVEVLDTCGSHLGHVFDDGPKPDGKRFCMNSVALYFIPD